jgi:hypothetical protein
VSIAPDDAYGDSPKAAQDAIAMLIPSACDAQPAAQSKVSSPAAIVFGQS